MCRLRFLHPASSPIRIHLFVGVHEHVFVTVCILHHVGGDHMTAVQIRGCQRIRSNAERGKARVEGFTTVVDARVAFLGVSVTTHVYY